MVSREVSSDSKGHPLVKSTPGESHVRLCSQKLESDETFSNDSYEEGKFFPDYENSDNDSFEGIPIPEEVLL